MYFLIYPQLLLFSFVLLASAHYPGIQNCTKPGLVALTFDDGPSPNGGTESVLKVLREKNVTATFFVTGKGHDKTFLDLDERKRSLLRQIYEQGHQVGSHTWSHFNLIKEKSRDEIQADILQLANTVYSILRVNMTILRPPYGFSNETVVSLIAEAFGYKIIRWNLDTKDWYFKNNIEASFKNYERAMKDEFLNNTASFITLHHDPVAMAGELAAKSIDFVRSKGFRLVTVGECIREPDYVYEN